MMIERLDYRDLTYHRFSKEFLDKKPVIIKGIVEKWPCYRWDLNHLKENYGDREIIIRESTSDEKKFYQTKLSKFISILDCNENRLYCDWPFSIMGNEDIEDFFETPFYFIRNTIRIKNHKKLKWIFLGSTHTGTPLHQDTENTHNWNAIVFGHKKWVFFSPNDTEKVKHFKGDLFNKEHIDYKQLENTTPYYIDQYNGEIMYTPRGWWHTVLNTETTFAISENFWYSHELLDTVNSTVTAKL